MWSVTPKISCTTTMPPFGLPFGSATYASSSCPSFAFNRSSSPSLVLLVRSLDAMLPAASLNGDPALNAFPNRERRSTAAARADNVDALPCVDGCGDSRCRDAMAARRAAEAAGSTRRPLPRTLARSATAPARAPPRARAVCAGRRELELELLREVHELLELLLDELGIARDARRAAPRRARARPAAPRRSSPCRAARCASVSSSRDASLSCCLHLSMRARGCSARTPRLRGSQTPPRRQS